MMKLTIKQEGVPVPPPSVGANAAVEIWRDTTGAIYAYGERRGDECWMHVPGIASYHFKQNGIDVAASVADGTRPDAVLDAYRRRVLPMAVQVRGYEVLHASAFRTSGGIVGLCGVTQTGKSTIAFGMSRRGYPLWCDDALAFDISNRKPLAISLPFELRLRPPAMAHFGQPRNARTSTEEINRPESVTAPLAALFVLGRADDQETSVTVRRLDCADAFLAVLSYGCWFTMHDPHDKRRIINHYMDLAAETPVFEVTFKSGLQHLPAVLDAIETQIGGPPMQ